jgi:hypothetical protein
VALNVSAWRQKTRRKEDHVFRREEGGNDQMRSKGLHMNPDRIRIIKLHKRWADGYTLFWQMFIFLLFGGIYFVLEQIDVGTQERTTAFVLLAAMVLVAAIWQATGLGIARIHMLLNGIDLEQPSSGENSSRGEARK